MKVVALRLATLLIIVPLLAGARAQDEHEWMLYAASSWGRSGHSILNDWYVLNKLVPVAAASAASALHYIDAESVASSDFEGTGGTVRVWEKFVLGRDTKPYVEVRAEVEKEERLRLGRELTVIDMAAVFPHAVNQAAKEVRTLFEINCESGEFIVLQVDLYDVEGNRMISERNSNMDLWYAVRPGTVMELLAKKVCGRGA
jgi:hypothetical protein